VTLAHDSEEVEAESEATFASIIGKMVSAEIARILKASSIACVIFASSAALAGKDFVKPVANPAKAYAAHDDHTNEKVAIAADPFDTREKAKIFTINFEDHGCLPIFFIVTNDGDQPISIANIQVTLVTGSRDKLTPAGNDDLFRRLSNPQANTHPIPIPIPQKKAKGGVSEKDRNEIESAQFAAKAVEPHTTQSGFLFFDVEGIPTPLAGARLYVTGVDDAKGNELMYFEIPFTK
jgi:hypothetical protein